MSKTQIGVTLQNTMPPAEFFTILKEIDELGYDYLWLTDSQLHARYCYSYMALAGDRTSTMKIGTNCTNPLTRHPALTANAHATLNELNGGRTVMGIGVGDSPVIELGTGMATIKDMRESISLMRRLYAGERFTDDGKFALENAGMHHSLDTPPPPIYVTASGPKMLEMAGELADGAIVACGGFKEGLEYALAAVKKGLEKSGRSMDDFDFCWQVFGSFNEDVDAAREAARPLAAWFPQRAPKYCEVAGIDPDLVQRIRAVYSGGEFHEAAAAHALATQEMIEKFTIAGGTSVWEERMAMARSVGVTNVTIFPISGRDELIRGFGAMARG